MKIKVFSDNFFITSRLKEIDRSYFILYDTNSQKFEVHSSGQFGNSYCLTLPFDVLDERAVDHVLKTRVQNKDEILKELDRQNDLLEKKAIKEQINKIEEALS